MDPIWMPGGHTGVSVEWEMALSFIRNQIQMLPTTSCGAYGILKADLGAVPPESLPSP